ncbi:MAG: hypothetical protein Ct9H300mP16_17670 [Pseudomonadota bacterium]|nr:MAG: hypothetical protein Ct9H300mP16_17670 [Pseudomonadota bacterium]
MAGLLVSGVAVSIGLALIALNKNINLFFSPARVYGRGSTPRQYFSARRYGCSGFSAAARRRTGRVLSPHGHGRNRHRRL